LDGRSLRRKSGFGKRKLEMPAAFCPSCAAQNSPIGCDLERAGFYLAPGGKGSHRKFRHERRPGALILSGKDDDDAQHYQEKQTRDAIREISQ
jgi:hypothetical protein